MSQRPDQISTPYHFSLLLTVLNLGAGSCITREMEPDEVADPATASAASNAPLNDGDSAQPGALGSMAGLQKVASGGEKLTEAAAADEEGYVVVESTSARAAANEDAGDCTSSSTRSQPAQEDAQMKEIDVNELLSHGAQTDGAGPAVANGSSTSGESASLDQATLDSAAHLLTVSCCLFILSFSPSLKFRGGKNLNFVRRKTLSSSFSSRNLGTRLPVEYDCCNRYAWDVRICVICGATMIELLIAPATPASSGIHLPPALSFTPTPSSRKHNNIVGTIYIYLDI